jgi:RNA polymerase sigma-70 factor, ECF subfamily
MDLDHRWSIGKEGPAAASKSYELVGRRRTLRGKMPTMQPTLVAPSSGEEIELAADGGAQSIAIRLRANPKTSRWTAVDRRREHRWIKDAQRGSGEALEALYRRHWPWAHRAAYLVVHDEAAAEDIAQEAFLAAVRALDRFDRRRPFGPWLHRIVVNRAIDWARARSLRPEAAIASEPHDEPGSEAGALEPERSRPYSEGVVAALASLSPEHRAVVVLRYLLEYTPGEIAEALDLPRGTVNSRLRRALDRLGKLLDGER